MREPRTAVAHDALVPESWMLGRLNRETQHEHTAADNDRLAVLDVAADRQRYVAFLSRVYGFEAPLEAALLMTVGIDRWLDLRDRGHLRLLRADLQALGVSDLNPLPRCPIGPFRYPIEALGWVYVVERNMLLHATIGPQLRGRLGDAARFGCAYLQRRSSGQRLRELGTIMDRTTTDFASAERIVAAAKAAFRAQHSWYEVDAQPRQQVA